MRGSIRFLSLWAVLITFSLMGMAPILWAEPTKPRKNETWIYFIGDELTISSEMRVKLSKIAWNKGKNLENYGDCTPEYSLKDHWNVGDVDFAIKKASFNYVILQERNVKVCESKEEFEQSVKSLDYNAKANKAKTILFMPYANKSENGAPHPYKQKLIANNYNTVAKEIDAIVAPVGIAWVNAYKARPNINLYSDVTTQNELGAYLTACVFYSVIYNESPVGDRGDSIRSSGNSITPETIAFLQKIAWDTVKTYDASKIYNEDELTAIRKKETPVKDNNSKQTPISRQTKNPLLLIGIVTGGLLSLLVLILVVYTIIRVNKKNAGQQL